MRLTILLYIVFFAMQSGKTQSLLFNNSTASDIVVCQESAVSHIEIENIANVQLNNLQISITIPDFIAYEAGSLTILSNASISGESFSGNILSFSLAALPINDILIFEFELSAGYDAYENYLAGQIFRNQIEVTFDGGSENNIGMAYDILYPALSITNVDPLIYGAFVGQSFDRAITIVNGGYGYLDSFDLSEVSNPNLVLNASDLGTLDTNNDIITLTGTDFQQIGNGNSRFERNESITVTLNFTVLGCNDIQSVNEASWGCDGGTSFSNKKYPKTNVSLYPPDLAVTTLPTFDTCGGGTDQQTLTVTNNGTGPAQSVTLSIAPTKPDMFTRIDASSILLQDQLGAFSSLAPDQTSSTTSQPCLGTNPVDHFTVTLPTIAPGETVSVLWDNSTCLADICSKANLIGWNYDLIYTDMCNSRNYSRSGKGQNLKHKDFKVLSEFPSDLLDGETGEFVFRLDEAKLNLPQTNSSYIEVYFNLPENLQWSGNTEDLTFIDGVTEWPATSVEHDVANHSLSAKYALPVPITLLRSEVRLKLTLDCSAPGFVEADANMSMQLFYVMDAACSPVYRLPLSCPKYTTTKLHCPFDCNEGLSFDYFEVERTSVGLPDNDLDGLPDENGTLDLSKIRLNRVMYSDTFKTVFTGVVNTSGAFPDFSYGYARSVFPRGNKFGVIGATITVTRPGTNEVFTCNQVDIAQSMADGERTVDLDFSVPTLSAVCNDFAGFTFQQDDQIELTGFYYVKGNIGGATIETIVVENDFYLSDTENGTAFQCNDWNGNFTLIGYYLRNNFSEQYNIETCTKTISQRFRLSIGNCCSNFDGGNLFPFEYRNWVTLHSIRVVMPEGYAFVSANMNQSRTLYTNASIDEFVTDMVPDEQNGNELIFNTAQYYVPNGGTFNLADDGFDGEINIVVDPVCTVNPSSNLPFYWYLRYEENDIIGGEVTAEFTSTPDYLRYKPANIVVSSPQPIKEEENTTIDWSITVENPTQSTAENSWLYFYSPDSAVIFLELYDIAGDSVVQQNGDFHQLGTFPPGFSRDFIVLGDFNSCDPSELRVISSYDCDGYPADLESSVCNEEEYILTVYPADSELQVQANTIVNLNDPCDEKNTVELELLSSKLAAVDDIVIQIEMPASQSISFGTGSTALLYPESASWQLVQDPVSGGNIYTLNLADVNTEIQENGLVGITDISRNLLELKFDLLLNEDFKPGDMVTISISSSRPCGDPLPVVYHAIDPSSSFARTTSIGLDDAENSWASSWGDYDNDGFPDLFVSNYNLDEPNKLYHNNGDGTFTAVTSGPIATDMASSLASSWGDYDNDGDLDLIVANNIGSPNFLYRNEGNGEFIRILNDPVVENIGYAHGLSWVDYDNDGYLDLFVADFFSTRFNQLYHNNGDGSFSHDADNIISAEAASSVTGIWGDFNNDRLPDLFVANTNGENNSLYQNMGGGKFELVNNIISNTPGNSIGGSWGDYDNDGDLDLYVTNAGDENNFLYRNDLEAGFTAITTGVLVTDTGHSHGSAWGDYDNDGDLDLVVTNDQNQNNVLYKNDGSGNFERVDSDISSDGGMSFGSSWADYDNDGDIDLFITNRDDNQNFMYSNAFGACQSKVCLSLVGTNSNYAAIGTKIRVKANIYGEEVWQMREVSGQTGGLGAQNELKAIFGLGDATVVDSIIVEWPSGYTQILTNIDRLECMTIIEDNSARICGLAYNDVNENCVFDEGEPLIINRQIVIQPGDKTVYTDENGQYTINLGLGSFSISLGENTYWDDPCGEVLVDTVTTLNTTTCGYDLPSKATCSFPDLAVSVSSTAHRIGFENLVSIHYQNLGTTTATDVVLSVDFGEKVIPVESSVQWDSISGTERHWFFPELLPGESGAIYITDSIATTAIIEENLVITANLQGAEDDCAINDNFKEYSSPAVGAFDPNDIAVSPEGYIKAGEELTYKIRFQNVGNAEVSRVRVEDELPEGLDVNSVVVGAVSHAYRFKIDKRKLVWTFENINMPDSLTNEPESHGFVYFKIKTGKNLPDGTVIPNKAAIFFDAMAPVITNEVTNFIGHPKAGNALLHFSPNPAFGESLVLVKDRDNQSKVKLAGIAVYDFSGQKVIAAAIRNEAQYVLNTTSLQTGCYFVVVTTFNGEAYSGKLLVKN